MQCRMQSLIIHMSSSTARRANAEQLLSDLPNAELVEAVDGRDAAQIADVEQFPGDLHSPKYPFALRPAEIGVFQSHRKCWQRIVDEDWEYALIAEDDLSVNPVDLGRALDLVAAHGTPDMYVRLPVKQRENAAQVLARDGQMQFVLPKTIGLQCICQVVGKAAAKRLLTVTTQIDRPVDTFLQMHWASGQPVHSILPNGNVEVAHLIGGSTIQTKTSASGKLAREFKRAVYRTQVDLRPQKA